MFCYQCEHREIGKRWFLRVERYGFGPDPTKNPDIQSRKHTLIFGLRGVCAYTDHAYILGQGNGRQYKILICVFNRQVKEKLLLKAGSGITFIDLLS